MGAVCILSFRYLVAINLKYRIIILDLFFSAESAVLQILVKVWHYIWYSGPMYEVRTLQSRVRSGSKKVIFECSLHPVSPYQFCCQKFWNILVAYKYHYILDPKYRGSIRPISRKNGSHPVPFFTPKTTSIENDIVIPITYSQSCKTVSSPLCNIQCPVRLQCIYSK